MLALVVATGVAACSVLLPVDDGFAAPGGVPSECGEVGMEAILRGDAADARGAWAESLLDGARIDIAFPSGYSARFAPLLQVLDDDGAVVMEAGDYLYGACVTSTGVTVVDPRASLKLGCGALAPEQCGLAAARAASNIPGHSNGEVEAVTFVGDDGSFIATLRDGSRVEGTVAIEP